MDIRNDRQDLHSDHQDVRSDRDVQTAKSVDQPGADRRMKSQTLTAMNERNDARDIPTAHVPHAATGRPLTATTLVNNAAAENNKKQTATEAAKKPWFHYFWW